MKDHQSPLRLVAKMKSKRYEFAFSLRLFNPNLKTGCSFYVSFICFVVILSCSYPVDVNDFCIIVHWIPPPCCTETRQYCLLLTHKLPRKHFWKSVSSIYSGCGLAHNHVFLSDFQNRSSFWLLYKSSLLTCDKVSIPVCSETISLSTYY